MTNPAAPLLDLLALTFALVTHAGGNAKPRYAGTAFFIGEDGQFMTAGHVVKGKEDPLFAVLVGHDKSSGKPKAAAVKDVVVADDLDAAVGRVQDPGLVRGIRPMNRHPRAGEDLLVVEYSRSTTIDEQTGDLLFEDPEVWKGFVVRSYKSNLRHVRPTYCYEVSFPAIAGASGAPLISMEDHTLAGMVVANVERELMPATVERVERTDGATEETRYYLPHAEAIAYTELIDFARTVAGLPTGWTRTRNSS